MKKVSSMRNTKNKGFSILEVLVSVAIFSIILLAVISFFVSMNSSNSKTKADSQVLENARKILDQITYEIKGAESVYMPTTTSDQLSLETSRYLPDDENNTFIDFFICGSAICLKKESQNPVLLTPDNVQVQSISFSRILNESQESVKIDLTLNNTNPNNDPSYYSTINLTSTASLRSY